MTQDDPVEQRIEQIKTQMESELRLLDEHYQFRPRISAMLADWIDELRDLLAAPAAPAIDTDRQVSLLLNKLVLISAAKAHNAALPLAERITDADVEKIENEIKRLVRAAVLYAGREVAAPAAPMSEDVAAIEERCRRCAKRLGDLAGSARVDVVVSADLLLEAAGLVAGYGQSLLVQSVLAAPAAPGWQQQSTKEDSMGQAFDREGNVLGEAFGETKREVFDKLMKEHSDAAEIRIRSMFRPGEDTPHQAAGASAEMPRYKCHKEVWALKIGKVVENSVLAALSGNESDGSALMVPADPGYAEFRVDAEYMRKHKPQEGGYYVVYQDGYKSFSPAQAFEEGYTRL